MVESGLQAHQGIIKKVVQLYETKLTRHGVMVVGKTGSGKSTCWKILQKALSRLKKVCTPKLTNFPLKKNYYGFSLKNLILL